jgi:hypothetical protein
MEFRFRSAREPATFLAGGLGNAFPSLLDSKAATRQVEDIPNGGVGTLWASSQLS